MAPKLCSRALTPQEPAPIDWAFYRKHITAPGVVDTFEKALKGSRPRNCPVWTHGSAGPPSRPLRSRRAGRTLTCRPRLACADLKLPKYEGKEVQQLAAAFAELEKKAEAAAAKSAQRMEEIKKEIAAIAVEKEKLKTLTIDEILTADPALREKLNQEIRDDKWY